MTLARYSHCAVDALRNQIYIWGGRPRVFEVFDVALLEWRTEATLCDMPAWRGATAAIVLQELIFDDDWR